MYVCVRVCRVVVCEDKNTHVQIWILRFLREYQFPTTLKLTVNLIFFNSNIYLEKFMFFFCLNVNFIRFKKEILINFPF